MTLRIPYWDWAYNATMPDAVNQPYLSVNTPQGRMSIANPLYRYTFHPQPSASDFPRSDPLSQYPCTVRNPDAYGNSQPARSNAMLQANAAALHDLTYQLIAEQSNYAPFSNVAYSIGRNASYNSIENMHNAIHILVGYTGHMAVIPYSGFDPIFWLHHANVDRLVAIWQAIYPGSFVTPQTNQYGTYTEAPGASENILTPLTPFYNNGGTFHTSATARYTRHFGYTYPEVMDWGVNATQLSSNVRRNLNMLYNPTGSLSARSLGDHHRRVHKSGSEQTDSTHETDGKGAERVPLSGTLTLRTAVSTSTDSNITTNNTVSFQYFINIRVDKSSLNQSFFIHFFLGKSTLHPPTPTSQLTLPNADAFATSSTSTTALIISIPSQLQVLSPQTHPPGQQPQPS